MKGAIQIKLIIIIIIIIVSTMQRPDMLLWSTLKIVYFIELFVAIPLLEIVSKTDEFLGKTELKKPMSLRKRKYAEMSGKAAQRGRSTRLRPIEIGVGVCG